MHVVLETERLLLRRFTQDDLDALVALDADPAVMRYLTNGKPTPREVVRRETLPRILGEYGRHPDYGRFALVERASGDFVGWVGLRPADEGLPGEATLGYRLHAAVWGRGYATEAARALVRMGFAELGMQRVTATTMAVNLASRRVMEKCGLRLARTFHLTWEDPIPGTEEGEVEYALTRDEWEFSRLGQRRDPELDRR